MAISVPRERGRMMGDALDVLEWLHMRARYCPSPFKARDLATEMGMHLRTAYRWLQVLEGRGLVDHTAGATWTITDAFRARWGKN